MMTGPEVEKSKEITKPKMNLYAVLKAESLEIPSDFEELKSERSGNYVAHLQMYSYLEKIFNANEQYLNEIRVLFHPGLRDETQINGKLVECIEKVAQGFLKKFDDFVASKDKRKPNNFPKYK